MPTIKPFKAVRPVADKVALVTCRNYDDYSASELAAWLSYNPFSFLHVIHPAYLHTQKTTFDTRFKGVLHKYNDFKADNIFIQEASEAFYVYEIQTKNQSFTGIVAGTSIADYQDGKIKKHEDTLAYRVELFKDYLHQTGFNTEPVLLTYDKNETIEQFLIETKKIAPIYKFTTTNKEKHSLWAIKDDKQLALLKHQFENMSSFYISDGHHRVASAEQLFEENKSQNNENLKYVMSFLTPADQVKKYQYNRMIHDLNGLKTTDFLEKIKEKFDVELKDKTLWKPEKKFEFGMYLDDNFYALYFKGNILNDENLLQNLDAQILYDTILHPILGIGDLRNDDRIDYISGKESFLVMKNQIDEGHFKVGFILYPTAIEEIKNIANQNLIMPPKSTYIEPKFRSGLLIYEL